MNYVNNMWRVNTLVLDNWNIVTLCFITPIKEVCLNWQNFIGYRYRLTFLRVIKKFFLSAVLGVLYIIADSSYRTLGDLFCFIFNILKFLFSNQYEIEIEIEIEISLLTKSGPQEGIYK